YLIATRSNRSILFSPPNVVEVFEEESDDRIVKVIEWFKRHRSRAIAWIGRVLDKGHEYYVKLEDRIDPGERVLKAMAATEKFVVYHGLPEDSENARLRYKTLLKRQRLKHGFWFGLDLVLSAVAIVFTPIL